MVKNLVLQIFNLAVTTKKDCKKRFGDTALTTRKPPVFLAVSIFISVVLMRPASADESNESVQALTENLAQHINACWHIPPAASGSGVRVLIDFELDRKGKLVGSPQISGGTRENSFFQITARSAIAAIQTCQPFKSLPPKQFALWKKVTWLFRP